MRHVDITINGRPVRAMVDTGAEVNIMIKMAVTRLGLSYSTSNTQLRMINAPPTPVSRVVKGVSITLDEWQGEMNFTIALLDLFDKFFGQEFFQQF